VGLFPLQHVLEVLQPQFILVRGQEGGDGVHSPINEAVRGELNTLRRNRVTGHDLLAVLDRLYHRHNLREANGRRTPGDEDDDLPMIVCSEGLGAGSKE
jgi:hypothetical protein